MDLPRKPFESVDSTLRYLLEAPTAVIQSIPAPVVASSSIHHQRNFEEMIKKEKEQVDLPNISLNSRGLIELLPSGRVRYGPITVNPRKRPSKTLLTGRRSKYEKLPTEAEEKRRSRRERNRLAATKCREKRENVLKQLEISLHEETNHQSQLMRTIEYLQKRRQQCRSMLDEHLSFCQSNSAASFIVDEQNFLPPSQISVSPHFYSISHENEERNSNPFLELTNSAAPSSTTINDQFTQIDEPPISMNSSSLDRLMESLHTPKNPFDPPQYSTGLFNSSFGYSCARQHSSSGEEDSSPSKKKNYLVY